MAARDEYLLRAKIFALLHFSSEFSSVQGLEVIFKQPLSERLFDDFWEIIRLEYEERMPTFGEVLSVAGVARQQVPATGSEFVEDWLSRVVLFR